VSYRDDLANPPSEAKSNRSQSMRGNFGIEEDVPMDQEINQDAVSDHSGNNMMLASKDELAGLNEVDFYMTQAQ